jgi:hypothetical protein
VATVEPSPRSHLFTVRVWAEELGAGQTEWRGRVQHVTSGEVHYFRDWTTLAALLPAMLPEVDANQAAIKPKTQI